MIVVPSLIRDKRVSILSQELLLLQLDPLQLAVVLVDLVEGLEGLSVWRTEQGAVRRVMGNPARRFEAGLLPAARNCRRNTQFELF